MKRILFTIITALTLVSCELAANTETDVTVNNGDIINIYGVRYTDNDEPYKTKNGEVATFLFSRFGTYTFDYDEHTWRAWRVSRGTINIIHDPDCKCMHKYEVKESIYTPVYDKPDTSSIFDDISW